MASFTPSKQSDYGGEDDGGGEPLDMLISGLFGVAETAVGSAITSRQETKADAYATDKSEETNRILGALGLEDSEATRELVQTVALIAAGTLVTLSVIGAVTWKATQA